MKQNDWIVATLNNPNFSIDDFKDIGLNLENTQILPIDEYLKSNYIKENPNFVNELNKKDKRIFNRLVDNHKEDFDTSEGAYQDLLGIIKEVKSKVSASFSEDQDEIIALDYALYRVAEKLLNCHLDYKSNT